MAEAFDPYLKWLGIRDQSVPVNHYRLLGLDPFESDPDVIAGAASRQIGHVKTFSSGPNADMCRRVLKELANARDVLSDADLKIAYDQNLRKLLAELRVTQSTIEAHEAATEIVGPNIDIGSTHISVDGDPSVPQIESRQTRRKKKSAVSDLVGWVLGAVGAVAFAYVLLNTDLIDRIKGLNREVVVEQDEAEPAPLENVAAAESPNTDSDIEEKETSGKEALPVTKDFAEHLRPLPVDLVSSNPTTRLNPNEPPHVASPLSTKKKKLAVPNEADLKPARNELLEFYRPQASGNDLNAKRVLAKTLITASIKEPDPNRQFAMLEIAIEMAGIAGGLESVIAAADVQDTHFQIEFWERLFPTIKKAVKVCEDFEMIGKPIAQLLERSRQDEEFELASTIAGEAANSVRKQGDIMQEEMLIGFAKDMKKLAALKRSYMSVIQNSAQGQSSKDNLTIGKYLCYGKNDWQVGLKNLQLGPDSALASIAKMDYESDRMNQMAVAKAWVSLAQKNKYKGLERRCMHERALQLVEERLAEEGVDETEAVDLKSQIKQRIQVVKKFLKSPSRKLGEVVFDIRAPATFDSAVWTRKNSLRIGLGAQVLNLKLTFREGSYFASTRDGKDNIKIRMMDIGVAEMRLYDANTNRLQNIVYGK